MRWWCKGGGGDEQPPHYWKTDYLLQIVEQTLLCPAAVPALPVAGDVDHLERQNVNLLRLLAPSQRSLPAGAADRGSL